MQITAKFYFSHYTGYDFTSQSNVIQITIIIIHVCVNIMKYYVNVQNFTPSISKYTCTIEIEDNCYNRVGLKIISPSEY